MKTLRARIALGVTVIVFCALLGFGGRFYQVTLQWTRRNALEVAMDKTVRFGHSIPPESARPDPALWADFRTDFEGFHAAVLGSAGQIDPENTSPAFPKGDFSVPSAYRTNPLAWRNPHAAEVRGADGERYAVAWYPLGTQGAAGDRDTPVAWTAAAIRLGDFDRRVAELRSSIWVRIIGISVGTWVVTYLLIGWWTRSLGSAADSAEHMALSDFTLQQLAVPRSDSELRRLIVAFNALLDRLRQLHGSQQRFVADAAHELRTPLTILRGEIQVALRKERDPARYQGVLRSNLEEVVRLSKLVENLLALARADAGRPLSPHESIEVAELCRDVCEKLRAVSERARIALRTEVTEVSGEAVIRADRFALERVLVNLVENALRHSAADDEVLVRVSTTVSTVRVEVIDHGPGITPEHLPHLFDRFYRVDSARNRASGGAGLGLAIVKTLTEAQGGRVEVRSEIGVGTSFAVILPRAAGGVEREARHPVSHSQTPSVT